MNPNIDFLLRYSNYSFPTGDISGNQMQVGFSYLLDSVFNTNFNKSNHGVFTKNPEMLTNDFFINLLDMGTTWKEVDSNEQLFKGTDRKSKKVKWSASRVDLIFGSNSQLRAIAEVYALEDSKIKFVNDFVYAWTKVMNLDRFDLN